MAGTSTQKQKIRNTVVYENPSPVAVALVPVTASNPLTGQKEVGVLILERGIPPAVGKLALPGGYLKHEDWREGLLRELKEETRIARLSVHEVQLHSVASAEQGKKLLLFGSVPIIDEKELKKFTPCKETRRLAVVFKPVELAFPTHTEALKDFFAKITTSSAALHKLSPPSVLNHLCKVA